MIAELWWLVLLGILLGLYTLMNKKQVVVPALGSLFGGIGILYVTGNLLTMAEASTVAYIFDIIGKLLVGIGLGGSLLLLYREYLEGLTKGKRKR